MEQKHASWLNTIAYPFVSKWFQVNAQQLHYVEQGEGEAIVFVHGTPTWSFDYRHLIKELCTDYRCVALDHIGFRLSSKPKQYDYSTSNHAATLEKFLLAKDVRNITLVQHDFGGPIGFHFALKHPERVKRVIVFNSWLWSSRHEPEFIKMSKLLKSPILPFLYKQLNFSLRVLLPMSYGHHKPGRQVLRQYRKPFANGSERQGLLAFARSLLNDQDWFEELWNRRGAMDDKPVLFVWGMKDLFFL